MALMLLGHIPVGVTEGGLRVRSLEFRNGHRECFAFSRPQLLRN